MNLKSGFFNSINGDRVYTAEDIVKPYARIVSDGVMASADGHLSSDYQVFSNGGLQLVVKKGFGIFYQHWAELEDDAIFTIPTPDVVYNRVDSIIVRADLENRMVTLDYLQGTPADNPLPAQLIRTQKVREYRLANIYVGKNVTSVNQTHISDMRPTNDCGIISNLLANSDMTATYAQWQAKFNLWFEDIKADLVSATAIATLTSKYTTTEQNEYNIPINIPRYKTATDILQVYVNGLICVLDVDYTITDYSTIKLTKPVDKGTFINFIVYKSIDTQGSETLISQINELYEKVETAELPLWSGSNPVGSGTSITPSKKLSECSNGWILVWSAYDPATGVASDSRFNTTYVPKKLLKNVSYFDIVENLVHALGTNGAIETAAKRIYISDTQIDGYAGNTAGDYNGKIALRFVYEY